jgi:hypothetical protein
VLHGINLMFKAQPREISFVPNVKLRDGENVPEGFMNRPEFESVCESRKANRRVKDDVQDVIRFLYKSAWRSSEAPNLEWSKVDTTIGY